ncbi:MAG: dicarboxylate/amino acid:cation symporter [Lentisphaeria bacterium]|nr:dicarboxylate/amino acid:cation symporter [Lentisphaeria bacterium]
MLKKIFKGYCSTPLVWRMGIAFVFGIIGGIILFNISDGANAETAEKILGFISPFGTVLISMLKMIVIPIIFFSLVAGAASLPIKKFGKIGATVLVWYFLTSLFAGIFGCALALLMNPKMQNFAEMSKKFAGDVASMKMKGTAGGGFAEFINSLFQNPFQALAEGNFLPIIIFALLFGIALRVLIDNNAEDSELGKSGQVLLQIFDVSQKASFKIIDWIMEYFPIGVFALTLVNFATYGAKLFMPYFQITICVIVGVAAMVFIIYPLFVAILCKENPYKVIYHIKEAIFTAFLTRSSAATLPVSFKMMNGLKVRHELSSFSLPLGATINMDGVCVHLPVFAILAANIFGIELTAVQLAILIVSVVFASVGAGGIPGGSVFLLFMVLSNLGLNDMQTATIVALAIGINPLLDMFETACNVTGDNVCTYIVAKNNGMLDEE